MDSAVARFDWGRWVADCPSPTCMNAMQLEPGQEQFECRFLIDPQRQAYGGCGTVAEIEWPDDVAGIERETEGKPESEQNWRPEETE